MSETISKTDKFSDNGETIYEFADEFLVVCPKCKLSAKVTSPQTDSVFWKDKLFAHRRVICLNCAFTNSWSGKKISDGGNADWYFKLPLWLQISCCNETLWAYNYKHLEFIENYVAAKLRKRVPNKNKSLASRLPKWIKSAKNRDEILQAIAKLKDETYGKQ